MKAKTRTLVENLCVEKSKSLVLFCIPGEYPNSKYGVRDLTYLNGEGVTLL